ncbi:hypothetical protein [Paraburkholderia unamae]|uniref:Uncharacterized protein n=1 Tax=Paraburkholderia unamae TaxID=219649 RepID=A0ACC6RGT4_9BURK
MDDVSCAVKRLDDGAVGLGLPGCVPQQRANLIRRQVAAGGANGRCLLGVRRNERALVSLDAMQAAHCIFRDTTPGGDDACVLGRRWVANSVELSADLVLRLGHDARCFGRYGHT